MQNTQKIRIGLISDTHGLLRPEALEYLRGMDMIIHAGDVGDDAILDALMVGAPLHAVRGNIDTKGRCADLPETLDLVVGEVKIHVLHEIKLLGKDVQADLVIFGHSHKPEDMMRGGMRLINPGSAGKRRFSLPICLAVMEIEGASIDLTYKTLAN